MSKKIGPLAKLHGKDKFTVIAMSVIPLVIVGVFVWIPALCTVILSFSNWDGIGGLSDIHFVGIQNYIDMFTIYPPFWPALWHNVVWLLVLFFIFTPLGMFLAVLLDKELKLTKFYQTSLYLCLLYTSPSPRD